MNKKRKLCVVITARPSYSRIKSALRAIQQDSRLQLQLVLAGPALLNKYGNIENILHDDGFEVSEKVYTVLDGENLTSMAKTVGIGLVELSNVFFKLKPHMVMVIADRFETISVSIAAAYQNIPLVHIQGGEITGSIDEKVRHANTKFADIHLVCSPLAHQNVMMMGEHPEYIFNTGCPSIDLAAEVVRHPQLNFDPYIKYSGLGAKPDYKQGYIVVLQHPVTTEFAAATRQVEETLLAIKEMNIPTFWFAPNADAGTDALSTAIRKFRSNHTLGNVHFFNNMIPADFLRLVFNSLCLVGNSSMGIRECSFMGVPVVNIGSRQMGRERGNNVIDVEHDKYQVKEAIQQWLISERPAPAYIYGKGDAGKQIADVLATVPLRFEKTLCFHHEKSVYYSGEVGV